MLPSASRLIFQSQLSRSLLIQTRLFVSNKSKSSNTIKDASEQAGPHNQKERSEWEKKEQGLTSDTETRQERIRPDEKKNNKTKTPKK
ncbi:unnamed protein product [Adineta ricciae]|uniref:Uncharacterized protein n=1 Tax=Adineta ricciae TaxID=249248 RepID=A0A814G5Q6_ADIRI|nr:unnamed protein product [Adineta ricciae]CAF1036265.1 unnamed protein product [Adineta ricciae]